MNMREDLPLPTEPLPRGIHLRVASPCPKKWEEMTGPGRVRHCSECDKSVYNLSLMTLAEVETLLAEQKQALPCVQFYRRADGSVLTTDCPVGKPKRVVLKIVTSLSLAAAALAGIGCSSIAAASEPSVEPGVAPCQATGKQAQSPYSVFFAEPPVEHPPLGGAPMPIEPPPPPPPSDTPPPPPPPAVDGW